MEVRRFNIKAYVTQDAPPIPDHVCKLRLRQNYVDYFIFNGICVAVRRFFFSWTTIDPKHQQSIKVLKSTAAINYEQGRHLSRHRSVIHPFSKFRQFWERMMTFVYILRYIFIYGQIATPEINDVFSICCSIGDGIRIVDVIMFFMTGYYDKNQRKIVLMRSQFVKRYLRTYFVFDLIATFPFDLVMNVTKSQTRFSRLRLLQLVEIVRLPTLLTYARNFCESLKIGSASTKVIISLITFMTLLIWGTTIFHVLRALVEKWDQTYYKRVYLMFGPMFENSFYVVRCFTLTGVSNKPQKQTAYMLCQIFYVLIGCVLNIVILSKILQIYSRQVKSKNRYTDLMNQLNQYMSYKELPQYLRGKILHYVEYKFHKRVFLEKDVMKNLSSILKEELMMESCKRMMENVEIFKDIPLPIMMKLVKKLKSEIFMTNDVIVTAGVPGSQMYFIYDGTVAVYTDKGKEICHLTKGTHFGEISLLFNQPRVATVVAITECELFRLSRRDYKDALKLFPKLQQDIQNEALTRLQQTIKILETS